MMRFTGAIGTALAALMVVPSQALEDSDVRSLEQALGNTIQAIEILGGIRTELESDDPTAINMLLAVTEPPLPNARERDALLDQLRADVGLLQTELDVMISRSIEGGNPQASVNPQVRVTHGLDQDLRNVLDRIGKPGQIRTQTKSPRREVEVGYSADYLRQAQACYRAGLYEKGLLILAAHREEPAALYWTGRMYEGLGRNEEAKLTLKLVAEDADAGSYALRAKSDLEFLEWKLDFMGRLKADKGGN